MSSPAHHRLIRALDRGARRAPVRLLVWAVLALVATWPLLRAAAELDAFRDAQVLVHYEEAARQSVAGFGELPLWDPWYCGGMYGLGTPQSRFVSPSFLLTLLLGTLRAQPVIVFFMLALGLEGAYRVARDKKATALAAAFAAPLFGLSGAFAVAPARGWINFMGFELLPWVLWGLHRALRGGRAGVAVGALAVFWVIGFGGTYAAPIAAVVCAYEVISFAIGARKDRRRLALGLAGAAALGVLAALMSAVRIWPVLETLHMSPRTIGGAPGMHALRIVRALLLPITDPAHGDFGDDGTFHTGPLLVVPFVLGLTMRRARSLVVAAVLMLWLASGYASYPALFDWLRALPLYSTLRYPERFLIPFALVACCLCAAGLSALHARARLGRGHVWLALSLGLAVLSLGLHFFNHWTAASGRDFFAQAAPASGDFHQARGNRWAVAMFSPIGRGSLSCWDAYPVPQSPLLRAGLADEVYLAAPELGTAHTTRWSPNRVDFDAHLAAPARVRVNQNWHPGWRASAGAVVSDNGLLGVDLPAGDHHTTLRFVPRSAYAGGAATLVAFACAIALLRRQKKKGNAVGLRAFAPDLALAVAPLVPLALALGLWREPTVPDARLLTPSGEAVVLDAPPANATLAGARMQGGVELVAVRLDPPAPVAGGKVNIELYWRVGPDVPTGLGVFLHIEPSQGDRITGDHATVSGVLELDKAPRGKVLRDVLELTLPDDARGKTWTIWGGLWKQRGRGERMHVLDRGALEVFEDRLLVNRFIVR